jgi:hypothetical protein
MRIGRFTTKQKVLVGAAAAVLAAGALIVVWAGEDDAETVAGPDTTLEHEATTTSTTVDTTTSTSETTTAPPTTASRGQVPGQVTDVRSANAGGSGEALICWGPASGATGYRVLRSGSPGGPFVVAADINVMTGAVTRKADVTYIASANHSYRPGGPLLSAPDTSPWFEYIDVGGFPRWFKIVAYNAAGQGPASAVLEAVPPGPPKPIGAPTSVDPPTTMATVPVLPPGSWPGPVSLSARPGSGPGEVAVTWDADPGTIGYRVLRADAPEGPFVLMADINVATGAVTTADGVTTIRSANHSYEPGGPLLTTPDPSPWFEYVDLGDGTRWYYIVAWGVGSDGPPSAVVSAGPPS